jgi:hypothetical protein
MANVEELKRVRTHIRRYPEKLNMTVWVSAHADFPEDAASSIPREIHNPCGTAACIAGRTVLLNGWTPIYQIDPDMDGENNLFAEYCQKDGEIREIEDLASELLGLNHSEADYLFFSGDHFAKALDELIEEPYRDGYHA